MDPQPPLSSTARPPALGPGALQPLLRSRTLLVAVGALGLLAGVTAAQGSGAGTRTAPSAPLPLSSPTQADPGATGSTGATPTTATTASPGNPASPAMMDDSSSGARIVMILTVLAGLAMAFVIMRKRQLAQKNGQAPALSLVGQLRVFGRWQVALVKVPGKTLVLGATDKGLNLLSTLEDGDLEAQAELARLQGRQPDRQAPDEAGDDLMALVGEDDRLSLRQPSASAGTRRPLVGADGARNPAADLLASLPPLAPPTRSGAQDQNPTGPITSARGRAGEPFGRLLDELTRELPRSSRPSTDPASGRAAAPAPGAYRDRMKTPEAQALRARLERYQSPTAN